jgi:ssDNA-binding replication factor A large subunit
LTVVSEKKIDSLISEIVSQSGQTKDRILELIKEKRAKVGGGYLTEQGAVFLVASDLGVNVNYSEEGTPKSLSEITSGESSSTILVARIMSFGLPKLFVRKSDSRKGVVMNLALYDDQTLTSISLWDSAGLKLLQENSSLRPGDLIKISNAYTRAGLNGSGLLLNLGEQGSVAKVDEQSLSGGTKKIPKLDEMAVSPSAVTEESARPLVVKGLIAGEVKRSSFVRSDGTSSGYLSFEVSDDGVATEGRKSPTLRTIIWGNPEPSWDTLRAGDKVTLLNVRAKLSTFQNSSSIELHGNESSSVLEKFEERRQWIRDQFRSFSADGSPLTTPDAAAKQSTRVVPFIARVLAIRRRDMADEKAHLLVVDSQKRLISVTASADSISVLESIDVDDVVVCKCDSLDLSTLRASCSSANSISKVGPKRPDIPAANSLLKRVEELQENQIASIDAMCLAEPLSKEIQTKDGLVKRSEVPIADHTGEIKLYAWRSLSKALEGFSVGDKILVNAVEVQSYEGKKFLVVKNYSTVEKKKKSAKR